jgi:hypothetical protein
MSKINRFSTSAQGGSVLVIGMLMLVLLSLLGIAVTTTSTIEMQVAANERFYKENLYDAEGAALEAAQSLENTDLKNVPPAWLEGIGGIDEANDMFNDAFWNDNNRTAPSANTPVARYSAVLTGFGPGSSLDVSVSRIHMYSVYGRAQRNNGTAVVRVNYRKAF